MDRQKSAEQYEVWCGRCRVSFPVGQKTCVHCGERVGPRTDAAAAVHMRAAGGVAIPDELGPHSVFENEIPEDELPRRSGLRSPMTIIWVVLALATAVYRACTGGAQIG